MALRETDNLFPHVTTDHLRLHQRKAFELCAAVYSALRNSDANPGEPPLFAAANKARGLAEAELNAQNDHVPLERFLADALHRVIREAEESAENFELSEAGTKAIRDLRRRQTVPPDLISVNSACLIRRTFADCLAAAKEFYSEHLTSPIEFPQISLQIGATKDFNEAFPGRAIAFNGSVRYEEDAWELGRKHSVVNIKVCPLLRGGCLPALTYILMHEILCHWPQMARRPGARPRPAMLPDPNNKDAKKQEVDPISEGWMDELATHVLRERYDIPNGASSAEVDTADEIHKQRIQVNRVPSYPDAELISPGVRAARMVRWLYLSEGGDPSAAARDLRRLACELNVAGWNYQARRIGCNNIIRACNARHKEKQGKRRMNGRDAAIWDGLLTFRKNGETNALLSAIDTLDNN
jgi:hypothetical protein